MAVFISSGFWGAPQSRGLPYYKSVGIRDLFGSIEGGSPSGGPPPPYAREKVKMKKKTKNTGLGSAQLQAQIRFEIGDFRPDP